MVRKLPSPAGRKATRADTEKGSSITEGKTKPKPLHTEATLPRQWKRRARKLRTTHCGDEGLWHRYSRHTRLHHRNAFKARLSMERCKKSLVPTEKADLPSIPSSRRCASPMLHDGRMGKGAGARNPARHAELRPTNTLPQGRIAEAYAREITLRTDLVRQASLGSQATPAARVPKCGTSRDAVLRQGGTPDTECDCPNLAESGRTLSDDEIKTCSPKGTYQVAQRVPRANRAVSLMHVVAFDAGNITRLLCSLG